MPARPHRPALATAVLPLAGAGAALRRPATAWRIALSTLLALVLADGAQARQRIGDLQGRSHRSPVADTRVDDIAGICNAGRNVVGLMPHPERAISDLLGSADGVPLLRSLLASAAATA